MEADGRIERILKCGADRIFTRSLKDIIEFKAGVEPIALPYETWHTFLLLEIGECISEIGLCTKSSWRNEFYEKYENLKNEIVEILTGVEIRLESSPNLFLGLLHFLLVFEILLVDFT